MAAIGAASASKEGQAAAADVGNFAQAGVLLLSRWTPPPRYA